MSAIETYAENWGQYGPVCIADRERDTRLNGFRTIDYCNGASGYEWDEFHVLRGPDGLLYVGHGFGCSCNYFGDTSPADLTCVNGWHDAVKRLRAWVTSESWAEDQRRPVALELESRLSASRPRKRIALAKDWWQR